MPADLTSVDPRSGAGQPLLATIRTFLHRFHAPGLLLVAYSGGSDSAALLQGLRRVASEPEFSTFSLHACTVDHQLRSGSRAEAEAAAAVCARLSIPHSICAWEGEKPVHGLQEQARDARYRLLVAEARKHGAIAILTGHTADDQAETIAMRAARGSGPGLSGMADAVLCQGAVWVLRPLLGLSRADLRAGLTAWGERWLDDPSNDNPRFERVRLRQGGLAGAREGVVGEADGGFRRLLSSRRQAAWLDRHVTVWNGAVAHVAPMGLDAFDHDALDQDAATALFSLSAAIGGKLFPVGRESRDRLARWLAAGLPGRMTAGGTVFDRRKEGLYLYREARGPGVADVPCSAGALHDGRYRLACDNPAAAAEAAGRGGVAAWLEAAGVPAAIARRAAPAIPDAAMAGNAMVRIIAAQESFLPAFDLPLATVLARLFGAAAPLPLPVRQ